MSLEKESFYYKTKKVAVALGATAVLALGVSCTSASQQENPPSPPPSPEISIPAIETPSPAKNNLIKTGQWAYMPGTKLDSEGLHVEYRDFRIVQQDGSGGQPNPPVNEYGTHLQVPENFALSFELDKLNGPASLQFYEKPPIVSDEFRVEPKSIRLTFDGDKLIVKRWDGNGQNDLANQAPAAKQSFSIFAGDKHDVKAVHKNDSFELVVDDKVVGTFDAQDTFAGGQLWMGADAESEGGHFTIKTLEAEGLNGGKVLAVDTSKSPVVEKSADGLQELVGKRLKLGVNTALWAMTSNQEFRKRVYGGEFEKVTPDGLKWQFVEPQPNVFDFAEADAAVVDAKKHDMQIHGHNLIFSEALPRWVQELLTDTPEQKAHVKQVLVNHVKTLVSHYKGVIDDWDINEIFAYYNDDDSFTDVFTDNVFYRALGPGYIREVIKAAHEANPNVRIWLNDYGVENDTGERTQAIFAFAKQLKKDGYDIYGFGWQGHNYDPDTDSIVNEDGEAPEFEANLKAAAREGWKVRVSEMDAPAGEYENGSSQSEQFVTTFKTCMKHKNCTEIGFWSVGPMNVWQEDGVLHATSVDSIFDQKMQPTQGYKDLQKSLRK